MTTENLAQKIANMEETINSIKHELERSQAVNEIANIMGKYAYFHMAGLHEERDTLFATKTPDVRVYFGENGYWEGPDAPKRAWGILSTATGSEEERQQSRVGMMAVHAGASPVIEVAGDGKTAKGVWIGIGFVARKNRETGEPQCGWEWDKYGIDFIKEDGKWKIWHHHIYRLLHGWGVDEKWAEQFSKPADDPMSRPENLRPDGPVKDDNPYRPDTVQRLVPKPPEPYETFDPKDMY